MIEVTVRASDVSETTVARPLKAWETPQVIVAVWVDEETEFGLHGGADASVQS